MYRIYIGSNNNTGELEREKAEEIISEYYEGYTSWEATGLWLGKREKTLVVDIEPTDNSSRKHAIIDSRTLQRSMLKELKRELKQEYIGIVELPEMKFL